MKITPEEYSEIFHISDSVDCVYKYVYNKVDNSETRMFSFFFIDGIFRAPSIALAIKQRKIP